MKAIDTSKKYEFFSPYRLLCHLEPCTVSNTKSPEGKNYIMRN